MRYVLGETPVTTSASKSASGLDLSVAVEHKRFDGLGEVTETYFGGSEERFLTWFHSQADTQANNEVRALLRDWEPEKDKPVEPQIEALYKEAREVARDSDGTVTRRTGVKSQVTNLIQDALAGKEIDRARFLALAEKMGIKVG